MENPDRIIHEEMGLEVLFYEECDTLEIVRRECDRGTKGCIYNHTKPFNIPDYTKWENLGTVFDWMRNNDNLEGTRTDFDRLEQWYFDRTESTLAAVFGNEPEEIRNTIAQWITSTQEPSK